MSQHSLFSDQYRDALQLVAVLFADHTRKFGDIPYIFHLVGVSHITAGVTDDEDIHIAALLHDVLEDISPTVYDETRMRRDFGDRITEIVATVTHDESRYGREESRKQYIKQLESGPLEACIVSGADLLHNGRDIVYWNGRDPIAVSEAFGGTRAAFRNWFHAERLRVISERLGTGHPLVRELTPVLSELTKIQ